MLPQKTQPGLPRMAWTRLSLKLFLIACLIAGSSIGLLVRSIMLRPKYTIKGRTVEGFMVTSMWLRRGSQEEFLFALLYPDGNRYGGGGTANPDARPGLNGVAMHPKGIHVYGQNVVTRHPECRFWVYTNSGGQGGARPIASRLDATDFGIRDFENLENTSIWNDVLRPELVSESRGFDRWWVEAHGEPNLRSRFTTKSEFDEWIAERNDRIRRIADGTEHSP